MKKYLRKHFNKEMLLNVDSVSFLRPILMSLAALGIFAMHVISGEIISFGKYMDSLLVLYGSSGVDIFLFASGFGIYQSLKKSEGSKLWLRRRFIKILVPYFLIILPYIFIIRDSIVNALLRISTLYFWVIGNDGCWFVSFILVMYVFSPMLYSILEKDKAEHTHCFEILLIASILGLLAADHSFEGFSRLSIGLSRVPSYLVGMKLGYCFDDRKEVRVNVLFAAALAVLTVVEKMIHVSDMSFICLFLKECRSFLIMLMEVWIILKIKSFGKYVTVERYLIKFSGITLEFYLIHLLCMNISKSTGAAVSIHAGIMVALLFVLAVVLSLVVKNLSDVIMRRIWK